MDIKKLQANLEELTGIDLLNAEKKARMLGDNTTDLSYSKNYQSILAAQALGISYDDFISYKAKDFTVATTAVGNFLLGGLVEAIAPVKE